MSDAARADTTRSDAASPAGAFRLTSRGGRSVSVERATREASVQVDLELDGDGRADVATGIGFLDHLLSSLAQGAPPAGRQEPGYGSSWWDRQRAS